MIKIYMPEEFNNPLLFNHRHSLIFDLEPDKFSYTTDIKKADVVATLSDYGTEEYSKDFLYKLGYQGPLLVLSLFHTAEYLVHNTNDPYIKFYNKYFKNISIIHTNLAQKNSNIYYDFLWERQRVYFTEYDNHNLTNRVWSYSATKEMYTYNSKISLSKTPKHYLAPMRIYPGTRGMRRRELRKLLLHYNGYISQIENNKPLITQQDLAEAKFRFSHAESNFGGGTWWPVHNKYYRNSIASIYIESLAENSKVRGVTEKTWDPLIKGHFIIPYAYKGFINDLKTEYNVQLPNWIDYSYDSIENDDMRFNEYLRSVHKFVNTDIKTLINLYKQDIDILRHNRNLFLNAKPQSLYHKVEKFLNAS